MTHVIKYGKALLIVMLPLATLMIVIILIALMFATVASFGGFMFKTTMVDAITNSVTWVISIILSVIITVLTYHIDDESTEEDAINESGN